MGEQILNFIAEWGLPHFLIGLIIINTIGILKLCKVFSKVESKGIRKTIYLALDIALSFGVVAIYYKLFNIGFDNYIKYSFEQLGLVATVYSIYEGTHLRDVWKIVLNWIGNWFKYNPEHAVTKLAKKIGFDEAMIKLQEEKQREEDEQKAKAEAERIAKEKAEAEKLAKEQGNQKVENGVVNANKEVQ